MASTQVWIFSDSLEQEKKENILNSYLLQSVWLEEGSPHCFPFPMHCWLSSWVSLSLSLPMHHCPSLHVIIVVVIGHPPASLLLSLSTGHLTCRGPTVVIWWGPCWSLAISHPPLHSSSSSITIVHGGKAREVGNVIHSPHWGIIVVVVWWVKRPSKLST